MKGQSQQLLQILTEVRRQIVGQSDITQNLGSMSPGDATAIMQEQQVLLQQTINSRIQNLLTPEQARVLQDVLMRHSVFPRDAETDPSARSDPAAGGGPHRFNR